MNTITYSRFGMILLIIALFLIWQTVKFLPLLQLQKRTNGDYGLTSSPVFVTVFYEALCPDSKNFIVKKLLPAVTKASRLMNVTLVPYGKAKTDETVDGIKFSCQHGPAECLANKIHACSVSQIPDPLLQVKYISCMISDNIFPELIGEKCAKELMINWQQIQHCANSEKINDVLKNYGIQTNAWVSQTKFIPTVLLNHKIYDQAAILKDFFKQLCSMFKKMPEECNEN